VRCFLQESRAELLQTFQEHSWLNMLHLHVGSQGLNLDTVIAGGISCLVAAYDADAYMPDGLPPIAVLCCYSIAEWLGLAP
jgi:diaminopimelate decarboxylase